MTIIKTMQLRGLNGIVINVEADVSNGFPGWEVVGMAGTAVKESKERIRTAIKNCKIQLLSKKYVINLSPADLRKEGSNLDLPIAVALLCELFVIKPSKDLLEDSIVIGELSLDGDIKKVNGIISICSAALKQGFKNVIVPFENLNEANLIEEINVIGVKNLFDVINYFNNGFDTNSILRNRDILDVEENYLFNFEDISGQEDTKRGLEIACAGKHNCLMVGVPGSGKTYLAKAVPSILPKLNREEAIEITEIYSLVGKSSNSLINKRPFRNPHHKITQSALIGGGLIPRPGEISLAHNGILFLDELTEFRNDVLDSLREPLEEKEININRVSYNIKYPANFMLIAAMNPCPCGYYGSKDKKCTCDINKINRYRNKISGPFMDRIDIYMEVSNVDINKLNEKSKITSKMIREKVDLARNIQKERYKNVNISFNSELDVKLIKKYCEIDFESKKLLNNFANKYQLSVRSYYKIIKVARTIADLNSRESIVIDDLIEAIHFKKV